MRVEVIYATDESVFQKSLEVAMGTTVMQAVELSGLIDEIDDVVISRDRLAIYGERVTHDHVLGEGDRVEVLRPLLISAAEARRLRAARR